MSLDQPQVDYNFKTLIPKYRAHRAERRNYPAVANLTNILQGTVMGLTSTNTSDVQTFTCTGTPTGGTFSWNCQNPENLDVLPLVIPYNCTSTVLQGLANLIFNQQYSSTVNVQTGVDTSVITNNITAGGGPWPGTPLTLTGAGILQYANIPLATATTGGNLLTGGSAPTSTVAHTTVGSAAGLIAPYSATVLAAPATAPVLTAASGSTSWTAGNYTVVYTLVTAAGESTASPSSIPVVLTAGQQINVTSITGLNAAVLSVNFYVDGYFAQNATVTAGATGTVNLVTGTGTGKMPPSVNTAYTSPNGAGTQTAVFLLEYPISTDANGRITFGTTTGGVPPWGYTSQVAPVFINGEFDLGDLIGLDNNAIYVQTPPLGRISEGSLSSGIGTLNMI